MLRLEQNILTKLTDITDIQEKYDIELIVKDQSIDETTKERPDCS